MDDSQPCGEMPRYVSHKTVWALKIADIKDSPRDPDCDYDGSKIIVPVDEGYAPFKVERAYFEKHQPTAGGYYVVYKGGYKSFSPAAAFEEGYTREAPVYCSFPVPGSLLQD